MKSNTQIILGVAQLVVAACLLNSCAKFSASDSSAGNREDDGSRAQKTYDAADGGDSQGERSTELAGNFSYESAEMSFILRIDQLDPATPPDSSVRRSQVEFDLPIVLNTIVDDGLGGQSEDGYFRADVAFNAFFTVEETQFQLPNGDEGQVPPTEGSEKRPLTPAQAAAHDAIEMLEQVTGFAVNSEELILYLSSGEVHLSRLD